MSTLLDVYQRICTEQLIAPNRQKDILTAVGSIGG